MPSLYYEQHHYQVLPEVGEELWSQEHETTLALRFPVHRACRDGDLNSLVHLLSAAPSQTDILAVQDPFRGWTPALWAAFFGQVNIFVWSFVLFLLSSIGDICKHNITYITVYADAQYLL